MTNIRSGWYTRYWYSSNISSRYTSSDYWASAERSRIPAIKLIGRRRSGFPIVVTSREHLNLGAGIIAHQTKEEEDQWWVLENLATR